jgi:predicted adenylyl cyclase CyaB
VIEVEVKARLRDRAAVLARVGAFARPAGAVDKLDEYWHGPGWRDARGARGFRIRDEGGSTVVTRKQKRREGGVESNREIEFAVSDRAAFAEFAASLGCEPYYSKRKRGEAFSCPAEPGGEGGPATIEVFELIGLGDFIEIEILVPEGDPETLSLASRRVLELLERAGLSKTDIEPRFYSELLVEAGLVAASPREP